MNRQQLAQELLRSFVIELETHVVALERDLLDLEKAQQRAERGELLHALFRTIHTIKGASRAAGVALVEQASHHVEDLLVPLREHGNAPTPILFARLFSLADALGDTAQRLRDEKPLEDSPLAAWLRQGTSLTKAPETALVVEVEEPQAAQERVTAPSHVAHSMPEQLEELVAITGEVKVLSRRLAEQNGELESLRELLLRAAEQEPAELLQRALTTLEQFQRVHQTDRRRIAGEVERLDFTVKRLTMVRFDEACTGLHRVARDVATASGKEVEFHCEGLGVELDRSVIEALRDPLVQLVRNAVDHGIEPAEQRARRGKSARGRVAVTASLRGSSVAVTIEDDGNGLDVEAIRREVRRRGLPEAGSDEELVQALFLPSFSTTKVTTDVSGRGVGLDIVKRMVERLRGSVEVRHVPGGGTCFTLTVPVTLSSMNVLFVRAAERLFGIPSSAVRGLRAIRAHDVQRIGGVDNIVEEAQPVPLLGLSALLGFGGKPPTQGKVPVVLVGQRRTEVALAVNELYGEHEATLRPLGARLESVKTVLGATLMANGSLVLVLSPSALAARALGNTGGGTVFSAQSTERAARRVLLVDDSLTTRTLERSILESVGYRVIPAADGSEAWSILQTQAVDLVVSDVEMPGMDGFALTEAIRASSRFQHLPVVLVTALASDTDRARGLDVGASAYIVKGAFDQTELLETLAQLL